jgi:hypothetical protein
MKPDGNSAVVCRTGVVRRKRQPSAGILAGIPAAGVTSGFTR